MGIRIEGGRDFSDRDVHGAGGAAIVSRSLADAVWPGQESVGRRISEMDKPGPGDWVTVVGVVDDVRQAGLAQAPGPALYFPYMQSPHAGWLSHMSYVVRTEPGGPPPGPAMRSAVHAVDANQPVEDMMSLADLITRDGARSAFQARLLTAFAGIALALAVIGVYGVLAYSVVARTREIGIRMALGADGGDVVAMVLRRTLLVAGCGLALGTAGSLAATRVLRQFLFEVSATDGVTFVATALVLGVSALAAGWIPARRAARVDPLVALRYE